MASSWNTLELVQQIDNFPYDNASSISSYYKLWLDNCDTCVGWILPWVAKKMPWGDRWIIDERSKIIRPNTSREQMSQMSQEDIIARTLEEARDKKIFKAVSGKAWRNELFQIPGLGDPQVGLERSGSFLFGVVTFGVHCTGYVKGKDGLKIWAPRRARTKPTYGGMLDSTVAGGMAMGDDAFTTLVKEASEEASLPAKTVRDRAKACGTISYFLIQAKKEGEETGLLQPTCKYVYDLKLPASAIPQAGDDEVEGFELLTVDQIKQELEQGKFRPSSTLVLLDFLIRHGIITADNEKDYADIVPRLHRRLPFPTSLASAAKVDGANSDADKEKDVKETRVGRKRSDRLADNALEITNSTDSAS